LRDLVDGVPLGAVGVGVRSPAARKVYVLAQRSTALVAVGRRRDRLSAARGSSSVGCRLSMRTGWSSQADALVDRLQRLRSRLPRNEAGLRQWAHLGSNQGPLACEASALPLSYAPGNNEVRGTGEGSLGLLPPGSDPVRNLTAPRAPRLYRRF